MYQYLFIYFEKSREEGLVGLVWVGLGCFVFRPGAGRT